MSAAETGLSLTGHYDTGFDQWGLGGGVTQTLLSPFARVSVDVRYFRRPNADERLNRAANLDVQYIPYRSSNSVFYALVGAELSLSDLPETEDNLSDDIPTRGTLIRLGVNFGLGAERRLSRTISFFGQAKYVRTPDFEKNRVSLTGGLRVYVSE
ncbi:MAG: hypothetical protein AAFU77_07895 [Myxococcota bacterium]